MVLTNLLLSIRSVHKSSIDVTMSILAELLVFAEKKKV